MGEIKSAFEIAMERTKGVTADKEILEAEKYTKEGKKLISHYLHEIEGTLEKEMLKAFQGKNLQWVREGMFQALSANLNLPVDPYGITQNLKACRGFYILISDNKALDTMFQQLEGFYNEYIEQRKTVRESLEQQFAPRLKQKQEELSKQLGGDIHLDPASDPEFVKYYKQTMSQLEERYSQVLTQVREELQRMFAAG